MQDSSVLRMVVGFPFTPDGSRVMLVRKNRPEWQAGLLNGPGGKVEPGERDVEALSREVFEEAGVRIPESDWDRIAEFAEDGIVVTFFRAFTSLAESGRTCTDEPVEVVDALPPAPDLVPRCAWLVPLCLEHVRSPAMVGSGKNGILGDSA